MFFDFLDRDARSWRQHQGTSEAWVQLAQLVADPDRMRGPDFPAELSLLIDADPALPEALASIVPGHREVELAFPPPPTRSQIAVLTEALVLAPAAPLAGVAATLDANEISP